MLFIDVVFAAMGDWLYAEDLETEDFTMPVSDLYLDRNSCPPAHLALSPSVLFHFSLSSVKIIRK